jgi:hypothetical protein
MAALTKASAFLISDCVMFLESASRRTICLNGVDEGVLDMEV